MTLAIGCPRCGRTLRLNDQHAGRQIRCPNCQQISVAPEAPAIAGDETSLAAAADPSTDHSPWFLQTPEGPIYGPIAWSDVVLWAAEGRIDRDCRLAPTADGPWRAAAELLPGLPLGDLPAAPPPAPALRDGVPDSSDAPQGWIAPHRGGLIFVLGLLGFAVVCPVFSFLAWVMGARDLAEMRARRMDRSGEGLTMGGMILGVIVSLLWMVGFLGIMTAMLLYVSVSM